MKSARTLKFADAIALLRKPVHRLVLTHTKVGPEYSVVPGGRVARSAAQRVLDRCHPVADGLFSETPQAWELCRSSRAVKAPDGRLVCGPPRCQWAEKWWTPFACGRRHHAAQRRSSSR